MRHRNYQGCICNSPGESPVKYYVPLVAYAKIVGITDVPLHFLQICRTATLEVALVRSHQSACMGNLKGCGPTDREQERSSFMPKTKQHSAAQRREQVKQQRDQRLNTKQTAQVTKRKRPTKSNPWPIIGGIVAAVAIVVGIFFYLSHQQSTETSNGGATALKA